MAVAEFDFTYITRKRIRVSVSAVLPGGAAATIDDIDVALLPSRETPRGETEWQNLPVTDEAVEPLVVGPEATDLTGALVLPIGSAHLWVLTVDGDEVEPVIAAKLNLI